MEIAEAAIPGCPSVADISPCACNGDLRTDRTSGTLWLHCPKESLGDAKISQVLQRTLSNGNGRQIRELVLWGNNLTAIPTEINHFNNLTLLHFDNNQISSISPGSLTFIAPSLHFISLDDNKITSIKQGALDGMDFGLQCF